MKYRIKHGYIASVIYVLVIDAYFSSESISCCYIADGKPIECGVSPDDELRKNTFKALPQAVQDYITKQFAEVFALPLEQRRAWIAKQTAHEIDTGEL